MTTEEDTLSSAEVEELVARAARAQEKGLRAIGTPLEVGEGSIRSPAQLAEARERLRAALWKTARELYGTERPTEVTRRVQLQLFEYQRTQEMYVHYNIVNTALMVLLITLPLAIWGLLIIATQGVLAALGPLLPTLNLALVVVSSLILHYMSINRRIIQWKCNRLAQLEDDLMLDQHSRFCYTRRERLGALLGPGGQSTEILFYWAISVLGSLLTAQATWPKGWPWILLAAFPLVIVFWWGARCKSLVVSGIQDYVVRRWQSLWLGLGGYRGYTGIWQDD